MKRLTRTEKRPKTAIVHLGPGAFFRAFNAVYTHEAMAAGDCDWGICAVSLRSPDIRDRLAPQGDVYTSVTLGPNGPAHKVITSISQVLVAPEDPYAVVAAMADPALKIVSLTITEKGYCYDPVSGGLNLKDAGVIHDLAQPDMPRTAPGFLVRALALRRANGAAPFTVLSCDNMPDNGALTRRVILEFAGELDTDLANWIAEHGRFPATMVDRITPATTENDISAVMDMTGVTDLACVMHEPFRQWVIEDNFVGGERPAWDRVGAQFVSDVAPFEAMKLRCLNGTHSTLAYLGYLAGYETISQTVADPMFGRLVTQMWRREIIPTVPPPEGTDLSAYCAALLERYGNPAIQHRTWQIAMDGSQKLPQRLLSTISDNLAVGRPCPALVLGVAGWMRYIGGIDEKNNPIDVRDPLAERLRKASDGGSSSKEKVSALLQFSEVFPQDLSNNRDFREAVTTAYEALVAKGAQRAVANIIA